MAHWNFWEWLAYSLIWIAAIGPAADMGLKMAPELRERALPVLSSKWWAFTPLAAIVLGTVILVLDVFSARLPEIPKVIFPAVAAIGLVGFGIAIYRSLNSPAAAKSKKVSPPQPQQLELPRVAVKTHPHDIPKKLTVIDEQIMPLLRDDGEIEMHIRRGRELLNNWKRGIGHDRPQYLEELKDYQHFSAAFFDRLYKIQQANPHFDDISALLDIGNSPYQINETYAHGLADFAYGIRAFGDPPYSANMDHKYFMGKGVTQMFSSGLANYGSWLQATRKAITELRKKIASGEA